VKTGNRSKNKDSGNGSHLGLEATADELRRIEGDPGLEPADSFHRDLHSRSRQGGTDYILASPRFNMSDGSGDRLGEAKNATKEPI